MMRGTTLTLLWVSIIGALCFVSSHSTASRARNHASPPVPVPSPSPIQLILEESGPSPDHVAAVDASLFSRDPFIVINPGNFLNSVNRNTRIAVFVTNLTLDAGETASDVHVNLIDSATNAYDIAAEFVGAVPGFSFTEVVFKVPDEVKFGNCMISVKWHNQVTNSGKLRIRRPKPIALIVPTSNTFYIDLPNPSNNCYRTFQIKNVGPPDSILDYEIAPANGDYCFSVGCMDVLNAIGSVPAGGTAVVTLSPVVLPMPLPVIFGDDIPYRVTTPDASNYTKSFLMVKIRDARVVEQGLLGTWSGTWSGTSYGPHAPGQPEPGAPISGNWILNLQTVDLAHQTAAGTLTWTGVDIYWTSATVNGIFVATPNNFIPDRTITFGPANTTLTYSGFGNCGSGHRFHLTIDGAAGAPNPSDRFYGPWFSVELNADLNNATTTGVGFHSAPYNPATFQTFVNSGTVTGAKSQ